MTRQNYWKKEQFSSLAILFIIFLVILVRSAWICDDAYITLRTVDNLYHGYGLTWNIGERVQTYTHPLWLGVIASTYFLFENPYFLLITLTIIISSASVYLLLTRLASSPADAILGILMLMTSRAFIDFSTSGLENPVSHLIVVIFIVIFLHKSQYKYWLFFLSLTASFGMLNRMDLLLIFLPALLYGIQKKHTKQDLLFAALGIIPIVLWELFSTFYYGFPFPNTAYAKLNTGISPALQIKQGVLFLFNSISNDPVTLAIFFYGVLLSFIHRDDRRIVLSSGFVLYLAYVIRIGGDYMSGRFLSVVAFGAVALIISSDLLKNKLNFNVTLLALSLLSLATPKPPLLYNAGDYRDVEGPSGIYNGIEDGRFFNFQQTGLLTIPYNESMPRMGWAYEGQEARERKHKVVDRGAVGAFGFYAGPKVHIVDWYGIGDPLLSKLPVDDPLNWRIGHFYRTIPQGYLETLESGNLEIIDPNLAEYYKNLILVTQEDLFDENRILEIWRFNIGHYQPLIEAYERSLGK